jgi:sugar lactone lactonase YvrE
MTDRSTGTRILATGFAFPECPRWHDDALWVSDMHTGEVSRVDPRTGAVEVLFRVPGSAAGLAWADDGSTWAVSMTQRAVYRWDGGEPVMMADTRELSPSRANELESDRRGGFFVSNVGFSLTKEPPRPTVLARLAIDGTLRTVADGLVCPNGMAISPAGDELLVAESYADRVTRFTIGADGSLGEREVLVQLEEGAHPDGMDRDADGGIWVAVMGSTEVRHIDRDGLELGRVTAAQPAWACRLGGDGLLYICTASGMDVASLDRRPGRIEVADPAAIVAAPRT